VPLYLNFSVEKYGREMRKGDPPAARKVTTRQGNCKQQIPFEDDNKKDKDRDKDKGRQSKARQEQEDVLLQQWIPFGMTTRKIRLIRIFRGGGAKRLGWLVLGGEVHGVISAGVF
jgi:hypothetical protein